MRQYWEFQSYIPSVFGQIINFFVSILIDFGLEIVLRLYWRALPLKHCFWWGKVEMTLTAFLYRRCSETHKSSRAFRAGGSIEKHPGRQKWTRNQKWNSAKGDGAWQTPGVRSGFYQSGEMEYTFKLVHIPYHESLLTTQSNPFYFWLFLHWQTNHLWSLPICMFCFCMTVDSRCDVCGFFKGLWESCVLKKKIFSL